jgi:arylsulfatase A-like enzyme
MRRLLFALLCAAAASAAAAGAPRVVVLVTFDTTRSDHFGCYGYSRPTTPFVDSLAARGVVFENAFSAIAHTGPSHASLLTGLYPAQHGVRVNGEGLPGGPSDAVGFATLAERFEAAGYRTAAFTSVRFLEPVTRGFGYTNIGSGLPYRHADLTVIQVLDWLKLRGPQDRLFLWIHLFDPHEGRFAPPERRRLLPFRSDAEAQRYAEDALQRRGVDATLFASPLALAAHYAGYDAQIRFADSELQRVHRQLEKSGLGKDAWWIVTADHGEGLGEHSLLGHGRYVYDEQLRVPLVFSGRGLQPRRVAGVAHLTDLWPTLVDVLGQEVLQPGPGLRGISLVPALGGAPLPPRTVFAERRPREKDRPTWEPGDVFAAFDLDWKYIAKTEGEDEFYDRRRDPLERTNLVSESSPVRERLGELARRTWAELRREGARSRPAPADPGNLEELKALGYVN